MREWADYFNELTRRLEHGLELEVTIQVVGEDVVGTEVERLPLWSADGTLTLMRTWSA